MSTFFNIKEIDRALWFIEILFYCYAIFYIYAFIVRKINGKVKRKAQASVIRLTIITSMFILLTIVIKYVYVERFWYHVNIPMFWFGIVYAEYHKNISKLMTPLSTLLCFIVLSMLTLYFTIYNFRTYAYLGYGLAAVIIIIGISRKYYIVTSYNSLIGIISLYVYLTHYKLLDILSNDRTALNTSLLIYTGLSLLLGLITYIIFNRKLPKLKKEVVPC